MKLRLLSLCLILLVSVDQAGAAGSIVHGWSQNYGDASTQIASDIVTDASGNIIVAGRFFGTIDLGGGPLASAGGYDIFIAKFDPAGNHIWSQRFGGTSTDFPNDLAVDAAGNIIMTGYFYNAIDFGGGGLTSAGSADIFIVKLDAVGGHIWSAGFGDALYNIGACVAADDAGNIILGGYYEGTVNMGGGALPSAGLYDIVLAKFDTSGNHLWSQNYGDADYQFITKLTTDSSGDIVATGYFDSSVDFGGGALASAGNTDAYIVKLKEVGTHSWSQRFGDADYQYGTAVAVDGSDNVIAGGHYYGSVDFGGGALMSQDAADLYLVKMDAAGAHVWSQSFAGNSDQTFRDMAVVGTDDIVITGGLFGNVDLGGGLLTEVGSQDVVVARYNAAGAHLWSQRFGFSGADVSEDVAADVFGNVILTGYYSGTIDFGGGLLPSTGSNDAFAAKFWQPHTIADVSDVPGDQGGVVNVAWDAFSADTPAEHAITEYTLWRGISLATFNAMVDGGATASARPPSQPEMQAGVHFVRIEETAANTYYWQLMKTVPAYYLPAYYDQVPTQYDSTSVSTEYQYFQIIAHTANPYVFYVSDPDSGYSVDNLPPAMVINLVGEQSSGPGGLTMTWSPNTELDLDHYAVYRGTTPGFVPGPGNLLATPTDPSLDDGGWTWNSGYYYKVAAVDEHENEGPPALLGPGFVTGVTPLEIPKANYLAQNVPNPFNPTTTITFGLKKAADVTLKIYDASGQLVRTLVDGLQPAGPNEVTWYGKDDAQKPVASGVYFYRLEVGSESFSRKLVFLK